MVVEGGQLGRSGVSTVHGPNKQTDTVASLAYGKIMFTYS